MSLIYIKKGEKAEDVVELDLNKGYTSKNKHFMVVRDGNFENRKRYLQFDLNSGQFERNISFKQGSALFRGFFANQVISRIQKTENISRADAIKVYQNGKAELRETRINNILAREPNIKSRQQAIDFHDGLVRKGNFRKLKKYS